MVESDSGDTKFFEDAILSETPAKHRIWFGLQWMGGYKTPYNHWKWQISGIPQLALTDLFQSHTFAFLIITKLN